METRSTDSSQGPQEPLGIATRARSAIRHSGLSQREISRQMQLEETKLSKALRGVRRFSAEETATLATITGVTANWLINGSDTDEGAASVPASPVMLGGVAEPSDQARRRRIIIEEAWRLFAQRGFDAVRIADIAEAAQTSSATVHYYYASKDEIFAESLRYSVKLAFDRQVSQLAESFGARERLRQLVRLQLPREPTLRAEWSIWMQTWARVAVGQGTRSQHDFAYDRWLQTVSGVISDGQRAGSVSGASSAQELALGLTALMDGLGMKVMTGMLEADVMLEHIDRHIDHHLIIHETNNNQT